MVTCDHTSYMDLSHKHGADLHTAHLHIHGSQIRFTIHVALVQALRDRGSLSE